MKFSKIAEKLKELKWYNLLLVMLSGIINGTGVALFLIPATIIDGGFSGTSFILNKVTGVHVSIFIVSINLPFFIFAYKRQGLKFICYSLIAIGFYSLTTFLYQSVFKISNFFYENLSNDIILLVLFGGLISGVGSGLAIRSGGAMDGLDCLAVVFAKKIGLSVGQFEMIYNAIQYIIACVLLKDLSVGLYSIVAYAIGLKAVDFVIEGLSRAKACFIVTNKSEEMAEVISKEMRRGVTLIPAKGYYSQTDMNMIYCVVNRFEIGKLKKLVDQVDKRAFVSINDVGEVLGSMKRNKTPDKKDIQTAFIAADKAFEQPIEPINEEKFDGTDNKE